MKIGNIYCIIRDEPGLTAKFKLKQKLNYYFGDKYNSLIDKRIFAVTGDISKPGFGLNQEELLDLTESIDVVINSAANVAHFGNYNDFYKTNVQSVKYIIDFCKSFKIKLYHISTISINGFYLDSSYLLNDSKKSLKKNRNNDIIFDESSFYIGQILENVYTRSKFEAEDYILNAISTGLDGYILRMGNLMPRFIDGVFQENILDNNFINDIISFVKIGAVPDYLLKYQLEFTPVDQASNAIYKLVTHPSDVNRIFNLYNNNTISVNKFIKKLKPFISDIKILHKDAFANKIDLILKDENSKDILKNLLEDFDSDLNLNYKSSIKIKSDFTIKYLKKIHFRWHKITNNYLIKFINTLREVI